MLEPQSTVFFVLWWWSSLMCAIFMFSSSRPSTSGPGIRSTGFPRSKLIHGFAGPPQDWITVLGVNSMLDTLVSQHRARPAVLVMPDANGGRGISLQCLNQAGGPQDANFLARDLPADIASGLRVQRPGAGWSIAGYSEGGFCAANLGLQHGRVFSYAGVLSGYFRPYDNQLAGLAQEVSRHDRGRSGCPGLRQQPPRGRQAPQADGPTAALATAGFAPPQFGLIRLRS